MSNPQINRIIKISYGFSLVIIESEDDKWIEVIQNKVVVQPVLAEKPGLVLTEAEKNRAPVYRVTDAIVAAEKTTPIVITGLRGHSELATIMAHMNMGRKIMTDHQAPIFISIDRSELQIFRKSAPDLMSYTTQTVKV